MAATASSAAAGTMTLTQAPPPPAERIPYIVRRKRAGRSRKAHIKWCDDVVDNEGLGKKSSKSCCVYHKPRAFDESSDESDYEPDQRDYNFFPPAPGASGASGSGAAASSSAPASSSA